MTSPKALNQSHLPLASGMLAYINDSVTPYHAVARTIRDLESAGFERLCESQSWAGRVKPLGKYFVTRNSTSILAFSVGGKYKPGNGIKVAGAHTDSPALTVRPHSFDSRGKCTLIGASTYGGGLWHTWFDRDLTIAGRVMIQRAGQTHVSSQLVNFRKPLFRVANLAIHLQKPEERQAFKVDPAAHLAAIATTELLAKEVESTDLKGETITADKADAQGQHPLLMHLLSEELSITPSEILNFDLRFVDVQPATIAGPLDEFVYAGRLDNLVSCYCALHALLNSSETLEGDDMIRMIALFDNEEIGSLTLAGARGWLLPNMLTRLNGLEESVDVSGVNIPSLSKSFILSVDGAHAHHPNYGERQDAQHLVLMNSGITIKHSMTYSTNCASAAIVSALAKLVDLPVQNMVGSTGSTIGAMLAAHTCVPTVDIGAPMLSMHSIREMCGTLDVFYLTKLIQTFFERYADVAPAECQ